MNQMNMAGMNPGNPGMGGMSSMMNNLPNGATPRQNGGQEGVEYEARLNTMMYGYFLDKKQWDLARSLKNSNLTFLPPIENSEEELNGVGEDSKNGIADDRKPADLPSAKGALGIQGGSFLLGWWSLFWDMYSAQQGSPLASKGANHLMAQNKVRMSIYLEHRTLMLSFLATPRYVSPHEWHDGQSDGSKLPTDDAFWRRLEAKGSTKSTTKWISRVCDLHSVALKAFYHLVLPLLHSLTDENQRCQPCNAAADGCYTTT